MIAQQPARSFTYSEALDYLAYGQGDINEAVEFMVDGNYELALSILTNLARSFEAINAQHPALCDQTEPLTARAITVTQELIARAKGKKE